MYMENKHKCCLMLTFIAVAGYVKMYIDIFGTTAKRPPIILFYEPHRERWFEPFNLSGVCPEICIFTYNKNVYNDSDAVIFFRTIHGVPPIKIPNQKWIYLTFEPPNKRRQGVVPNIEWLNVLNKFDWLMSYEKNSEIYVPFGSLLKNPTANQSQTFYSTIYSKKDKEVAWIVSHCSTHSLRERYVQLLRKYIKVDIYGECGKPCPVASSYGPNNLKTFDSCKTALSERYKFFLSFENSLCEDYTSEKAYGIYESNNYMIPVVRGDPNVSRSLPNGTYISTFDFYSVKRLADYLKFVGSNEKRYTDILKAKLQYKVKSWHDNYVSAVCDLCAKLKSKKRKTPNKRFNLRRRIMVNTCLKPNDII